MLRLGHTDSKPREARLHLESESGIKLKRFTFGGAVGVLAMLSAGWAVAGGTENYAGPSGSWGNSANWSPQTVPVNGDDVFVSFSVSGRTVMLDRDYAGAGLHLLQIAGNTLDINGHTLRAQQFSFVANPALIVGAGSSLLVGGASGADHTQAGGVGGNGSGGPVPDASGGGLTFTGGVIDLSGGNGGSGEVFTASNGNGAAAGSLTLGGTSSVTLSGGSSILLRGGSGWQSGTIIGGSGGSGGSVRVNSGSRLTLSGGTLDLRGGVHDRRRLGGRQRAWG